MSFLAPFRRWLGRPLNHTEEMLVNALETQRILAGYVRVYISDSGTRGPAIRKTLCLYMRYISSAVTPGATTAVFARTLRDARTADIPKSVHASAFVPNRLRGCSFHHALILDASSFPCHVTGAIRPDAFADISRCAVSTVPVRGSVVIVHGDAFVRGHSLFKYEFYRVVKSSPGRFFGFAACAPPPPSVRRKALVNRLQNIIEEKPRRVWEWTEEEHRRFYSSYCRRDTSWPEYMRRIETMKTLHEQDMRQRRQALAERRRLIRQCHRWESPPRRIPSLEDLDSQPSLLCMALGMADAVARRHRRTRFRKLTPAELIRLCGGHPSAFDTAFDTPPSSFLSPPGFASPPSQKRRLPRLPRPPLLSAWRSTALA